MGDGRLLQLHYLLPVRLRDFFGYWVCVIQWRNISISRTIKSLMLFILNYARILAVYHDFDKREGIRIRLLTWPNVRNHAEITWQKDWLVKVLCKLIHPMCTCWCDLVSLAIIVLNKVLKTSIIIIHVLTSKFISEFSFNLLKF